MVTVNPKPFAFLSLASCLEIIHETHNLHFNQYSGKAAVDLNHFCLFLSQKAYLLKTFQSALNSLIHCHLMNAFLI